MTNDKYGILLGIMVVAIIIGSVITLSIAFDSNGQSIITATQPYHSWINNTMESLK